MSPLSNKLYLILISLTQMAKIDENQEAIAIICMAVDDNDRALQRLEMIDESEPELTKQDSGHWTFGSPRNGTRINSQELEQALAPTDSNFSSFDKRLRIFIADNFPNEAPRYEDMIYVCLILSEFHF